MFDEDDLLAAAGPTILARGEQYVQYVHGLRVRANEASASIQARRVYAVGLTWRGRELDGDCTCPHRAGGAFCKHLTAVGLAVLGSVSALEPAQDVGAALHSFLDGLDRAALVELIEELLARDESALRLTQARAASTGSLASIDADELVKVVSAALPTGFIEYRRAFDVASRIHSVLDDLEQLLDAGAADATRPALERATTRLRRVLLNADDSSGVIGDAGQRAAELHARSCVQGRPDPAKLARWLAKFRSDSPGWPDVDLAMYVAAFDDRALGSYRAAVGKLDRARSDVRHFEIDRMLLELADHDGDLDEAVRLLSRDPEYVSYGAIIARLRAGGRSEQAITWLDRAVAAGRVSHHLLGGPGNEFWISPGDAAASYLAIDRAADAIAVLRQTFEQEPGPHSLRLLVDAAEQVGQAEAERGWAIGTAERLAGARRDGAALVRIALAEGELVSAWAAAERFGAGSAWRELAEASAEDLPMAAAELYRPALAELLTHADTRVYPQVAATLATVRSLYAKVGEDAAFATYLTELRERYRRRTSLISQLNRAGLR